VDGDRPDEGLSALVARALEEDLGESGDATTRLTCPGSLRGRARIHARSAGVISGHRAAREVFRALDPGVDYRVRRGDGEAVRPEETVAVTEGPLAALLTGERTALNFLQHLSGIATRTRLYVEALRGTGVTLLDTRKTVPGLRGLAKEAVRHGGGSNHRTGLHDMILVKENHAAAAGGAAAALERVRKAGTDLPVEVEVRDAGELEALLPLAPDRVLLDNFDPDGLRGALAVLEAARREGRCPEVEVSGGVTLETVRSFALPGVDFISVGEITHSAPILDLSLLLEAPS
jgi:nicotinate-nucleotide pyrophosphorylase (carboxylating)